MGRFSWLDWTWMRLLTGPQLRPLPETICDNSPVPWTKGEYEEALLIIQDLGRAARAAGVREMPRP
jgi:hypothetical protein